MGNFSEKGQKKGKKKSEKRAKYLKICEKMYKIWKYFEGQVIASNYCTRQTARIGTECIYQ